MMRDYAAEYRRRLELAEARGLSRSQARGHPREGELGVRRLQQTAPEDLGRLARDQSKSESARRMVEQMDAFLSAQQLTAERRALWAAYYGSPLAS